MIAIPACLKKFHHCREGNVALLTALPAPLVVASLALGIDAGAMSLQKRNTQMQADLAAIVAAARPADAERILMRHFLTNRLNLLVKTGQGYLTPRGEVLANGSVIYPLYEGVATIETGHYTADAATAVDRRFTPGAAAPDSVRVTIQEPAKIYFAEIFGATATVAATGTASAQKYAAFSIGSRLASVNEGLLNAVLGSLLGTKLTLNAMDYRALADLDVNLLHVMDALATDLGLTALTYDELLRTDISYARLLNALGRTTGVTPNAAAILSALERSLGRTALTLKLEKLANLGTIGDRLIGNSNNLAVTASLLQLVNAGATAANGGKQLSAAVGAGIPGLADVKLHFAIGEPPVETPALKVGAAGSAVRTAQTRLALEVSVAGAGSLLGVKIRLPLYVEAAYAEAKLADIQCSGLGGNASVALDVVPAVAEVALGDVDPAALQNFSSTPRVTKAKIIDALLLKISAKAHVEATNLTARRESFSANDIQNKRVKTVSTRDTLNSLVSTLLQRLELTPELLGLGLPITGVQEGLAKTLAPVLAPLDGLLYDTLLMLGVRVGEADIRVSDVRCQGPVLVQ